MKKSLVILLVTLVALALLASCKNSPDTTKKGYTGKEYALGSTGPGGGIVFYDVDADNDVEYTANDGTTKKNKDGLTSDECGWRYLEAASANAYNNNTSPTFVFGYYRTSSGNTAAGTSFEVNGGDKIGTGKDNTDNLNEKIAGGSWKATEDGSGNGRDYYAASIVKNFNDPSNDTLNKFGGKTDWYLPSLEEAVAMVKASETITSLDLGDSTYWTSTEDSNYGSTKAYAVSKSNGATSVQKSTECSVRAIRRF